MATVLPARLYATIASVIHLIHIQCPCLWYQASWMMQFNLRRNSLLSLITYNLNHHQWKQLTLSSNSYFLECNEFTEEAREAEKRKKCSFGSSGIFWHDPRARLLLELLLKLNVSPIEIDVCISHHFSPITYVNANTNPSAKTHVYTFNTFQPHSHVLPLRHRYTFKSNGA